MAFALNSIVRGNHVEQMIWAFANLRVFDHIAAAGLLAIVVCYVIAGTNAPRAIRGARMIAIRVMLVALVEFTRQFLFHDIARDSPSLVLKPFTLLSEQTSTTPRTNPRRVFPAITPPCWRLLHFCCGISPAVATDWQA